jgi:hypothetical protein
MRIPATIRHEQRCLLEPQVSVDPPTPPRSVGTASIAMGVEPLPNRIYSYLPTSSSLPVCHAFIAADPSPTWALIRCLSAKIAPGRSTISPVACLSAAPRLVCFVPRELQTRDLSDYYTTSCRLHDPSSTPEGGGGGGGGVRAREAVNADRD